MPREAPVMILPGTVLFPGALVPLFIFEPRYRAMLAHALKGERMFCLTMARPNVDEARSAADFYHVAGLGLVRACVGREDGTSHLVLQGIARVALEDFPQEKPFRIASLRVLEDEEDDAAEVGALHTKILKTCAELPVDEPEMRDSILKQLRSLNGPAALADAVAHTFVSDSNAQQALLEEQSVAVRMRMLTSYLAQIRGEPGAWETG